MVHFFGPYPYRCPFGSTDPEECGQKTLAVLKEQLMYDNPKSVAAIIMEPIVGTNGIVIPPKSYMKGLRQLCDENGILLIIDEVMAGWGRAGKWFGIEHFDIVPDIITTAKGITSGYVQLGATIWTQEDLGLLPGAQVHQRPDLLRPRPGLRLRHRQHRGLQEGQPDREVRRGRRVPREEAEGAGEEAPLGRATPGAWACGPASSWCRTRRPRPRWPGYNDSIRNVSGQLGKIFMDNGLYLYSNWDYIFISPPLIITRPQIDEMVAIIEKGLDYTDTLVKKS